MQTLNQQRTIKNFGTENKKWKLKIKMNIFKNDLISLFFDHKRTYAEQVALNLC